MSLLAGAGTAVATVNNQRWGSEEAPGPGFTRCQGGCNGLAALER